MPFRYMAAHYGASPSEGPIERADPDIAIVKFDRNDVAGGELEGTAHRRGNYDFASLDEPHALSFDHCFPKDTNSAERYHRHPWLSKQTLVRQTCLNGRNNH